MTFALPSLVWSKKHLKQCLRRLSPSLSNTYKSQQILFLHGDHTSLHIRRKQQYFSPVVVWCCPFLFFVNFFVDDLKLVGHARTPPCVHTHAQTTVSHRIVTLSLEHDGKARLCCLVIATLMGAILMKTNELIRFQWQSPFICLHCKLRRFDTCGKLVNSSTMTDSAFSAIFCPTW